MTPTQKQTRGKKGASKRAARSDPRPYVAIVVESSHGSGRNVLRGIGRYLREHGSWRTYHEFRNTDRVFPSWLNSWDGDGIIARVENRRIGRAMQKLGVPVVDVLGEVEGLGFPLVHPRDEEIARLAAEHLLERGFRSFAFCGVKGYQWSARRREGFIATLAEEGYTCAVNEFDAHGPLSQDWDASEDQMADWLSQLPLPTGVMVSNDLHGQFVIEACRRAGIAVPDEIAIVAVDNDEPLCQVCDPPLSSVVSDDQQVGYEAARLLGLLMKGKKWDGQDIWTSPARVVSRLSSDSLAMDDRVVAEAIRFIRENACKGKGVDDVVAHVHISRSLLQRRFKEALGRTLHDEFFQVRLNHARFLLEESDMPIAWVAEKSAFNHQAYLGKVFKRELGMTPLEYRNTHKRS